MLISKAGILINKQRDKAFTLIEVLFSVMIITVIATAIASSSINNISYAQYNKQLAEAHLLAESKLSEMLSLPSSIGENNGNETVNNTEYKWSCSQSKKDITAEISDKTQSLTLLEIKVTVTWQCNDDEKSITTKEYTWEKGQTKEQR